MLILLIILLLVFAPAAGITAIPAGVPAEAPV
jgi:hypothetical protein